VSERRKFWMRWRVRTGYPVALIYLYLATPAPRAILIGSVIAAVGLLIRGASAGHLRKDQVLALTGPYAFTRNPLYFGSAFLAAGFLLAGHSWAGGAVVAVYFIVFYSAVMRNEEEDLRARFGALFDRYAQSVPLFFPRVVNPGALAELRDPQQAHGFSWAQFRRNREYNAIAGAIVGMAVVAARMWIRSRYGY
jgi:protein-S-isoprenylcysteine O-methyltransferase Ste14